MRKPKVTKEVTHDTDRAERVKDWAQAPGPKLVKAGNHYININDVSSIRSVKDGELFVVKFISEPNPEFPCFLKPREAEKLLDHFEVVK